MTKKPTPRMDALLAKVQSACEGRENYGRKADLARFLGVTPQLLHCWIVSRQYEPGGEATLGMLEWLDRVTTTKATQQKTPGGVSTTTKGRKTRIPHPKNEKSNRVRKKRNP